MYDVFKAFIPSLFEPDKAKKEQMTKKFFGEDLPKHLQNLETLAKLYGKGGPFFVGNHLTWADLFFHSFIETLLGMNGAALDNSPWFKQNRAEVEKNPKIAEYLKTRPKTDR